MLGVTMVQSADAGDDVATRLLKACTVSRRCLRGVGDAQSSPNLTGCRDEDDDEGHLWRNGCD